jgi:hypothetical protein
MTAMNFGADYHRFLKFMESKQKCNNLLLENVYNEYIKSKSRLFSELAESFLGQTAILHNLSNKTPIISINPMELYKDSITSIRIANNTSPSAVDCFKLGFWLEDVRLNCNEYLSKQYPNGKIINKSIKNVKLPIRLEDKGVNKYIINEFEKWEKRKYIVTKDAGIFCYYILIYLTEIDDIIN